MALGFRPKGWRIEEPAEAAQAMVAQTHEAGQPTSPYVGATWAKKQRPWWAAIWHEGRPHHVGYFDEEQDATRAFDKAALRWPGAPRVSYTPQRN